jgi:uncharacterized protein (DUF983 family)
MYKDAAEIRRTVSLRAMLQGRCPRCREGAVFKSGLGGLAGLMNDTCPHCGLRFLREAGYFLGAMYVSYGLGVLTILPLAIVLTLVVEWPVVAVLAVVLGQTLLSAPLFFRYSRAIWLHVDQRLDPR